MSSCTLHPAPPLPPLLCLADPPCMPAQVARVVSVEALPSSDKLYKTRVQVAGGEERQVTQQYRHVHRTYYISCVCCRAVCHIDGPPLTVGCSSLDTEHRCMC